jgi:hypothetical protein
MVFKKKEKIAPSVITCPARTAFIGVSSSSSFFLFFFLIFFFTHCRKMKTKPRVEGLDVTGFRVQTP